MYCVFALQINLKDITKRPLRLTAQLGTDHKAFLTNLKLVGEELWYCHADGIAVYNCQWNRLREIKLGQQAMSVAALDTKTVVIAFHRGLVISSTSGITLRIVNVYTFCRFYIMPQYLPFEK